jgi:hypothetical protein
MGSARGDLFTTLHFTIDFFGMLCSLMLKSRKSNNAPPLFRPWVAASATAMVELLCWFQKEYDLLVPGLGNRLGPHHLGSSMAAECTMKRQ